MAKKGKDRGDKHTHSPRVRNRRARRDYDIGETIECGIALKGSEVKAIRDGRVSIDEAFARVEPTTGELWLYNMDVGHYSHAPAELQHDPKRPRKLLARKREILRLEQHTIPKGTTLIPLTLFFNSRGIAKVDLAVATGKRKADKRESVKKKEADRAMRRAMTRRKIG